MLQQLINHSTDLKRLRDEGYELETRSGYLLVHNIPYLNRARDLRMGTLVSELTLANSTTTTRPGTHVIFFIGEFPCNKDGSLIAAIQHVSQQQALGEGILVDHSFSNKPQTGYSDYYAKITRYAEIISAAAQSLYPGITPKTFKVIPDKESTSVFHYIDTNSSRAGINEINDKLSLLKIGIIGLGGTGAYILDLVAKTPVAEIHIFDADDFLQHNAFRCPGAVTEEQLQTRRKKVDYYNDVYSGFRKGIVAHAHYVNNDNLHLLDNLTFVFICVDSNVSRKLIIDYLNVKNIPFIDVGMGILEVDGSLIGTIRCTAGTKDKRDHLLSRVPSTDDDRDNAYTTNIQIADLNALNASLAVIKWKKIVGFYQDLEREHHSTYSINVAQLLNEDIAT